MTAVGVGAGSVAAGPDVVGQRGRQLVDVVALVAVLGHRLAALSAATDAPRLPIWAPEVVEVVLARDLLAAGLEHAAQQVADERAARVADVERAGRVGRHELDVDRAGADRADPAPARRVGEDRGDRRLRAPRRAGEG